MYNNKLTQREKEIFRMLCINGFSKKRIAKELFLSETTVETHINNICMKNQFFGKYRIFDMVISFWQGVTLKMMNCEKCTFNSEKRCFCKDSQFFLEDVNSQMICTKFKQKEEESEYKKNG